MAKKKVQLKKTPSVKKAKKVPARKAQVKKKVKAVPAKIVKVTLRKAQPKKKVKVVLKKAQPKEKATADKVPKKLATKKKAPPTNALQTPQIIAKMPEGRPVVAENPVTYPNLRRRVGELLDKLDDGTLQWLHYEMTNPDSKGEIETAKQAEEANKKYSPLNRPALVQELTSITVDDFQLADESEPARWLTDENSIYAFLIMKKG